jgi:hypothetical protein
MYRSTMLLKHSLSLFLEGGFIPLRTLLSSRVVASTIAQNVETEIFNDNVVMNFAGYFMHQCANCRAFDVVSMMILVFGIIAMRINAESSNLRLASIDDRFADLRKYTNKFVWVCFLVFTKNIENAI